MQVYRPMELMQELLEKLGMKTVETTTPWYTGKVRFDGIPLNKLMDLVGAKGQSVRVLALNDYFDRQERLMDDPYLETREKEDAFLRRIQDTIASEMQFAD